MNSGIVDASLGRMPYRRAIRSSVMARICRSTHAAELAVNRSKVHECPVTCAATLFGVGVRAIGSSFNWSIQAVPSTLCIKSHGRLADHLDLDNPGLRRNYEVMTNA